MCRVLSLRTKCLALLTGMLLASCTLPAALHAQYFQFGKNKVQYDTHDWSYLQSKHFDVYYYEGGYHLANYTAKAAEAAYDQIGALFQYQISDRIPLIVYQSHNDFSVTNAFELPTYSEGIGGVTELFKNRVAIPFTGDYREYRRVLHHELVHAVTNDMFFGGSIQSVLQNNIRLSIPLWFSEGLAEYAALGWDTQSDMYVREAILEDHLAPIEQLNGYFAYRGGQSVWDYIAELYGEEKISEILQRVRLTRSVEGSFKRATGITLEELSGRWQQTLKEIYYPEIAAREDLNSIARDIINQEDGYYHTSPAISPQGDRVAYVTSKGALFDIYLAQADDGKVIKKLVDGQSSTEFESLRILTPGISWDPNGRQIAVAVKSGSADAIAVVNVESGKAVHYRVPGIAQIISVAWSPLGHEIAFEASAGGQSDIYVLNLITKQTVNLTGDIFSDHEPSWRPDGKALVFHSDRGSYTEVGRISADGLQMTDHESQHDLYLLKIGESHVERLTFDQTWDDQSARFDEEGNRLLFISDRNGIYNLYEKDLSTGAVRPVTDVIVGITQLSLSADGNKAALVSLSEGVPSIFVMQQPFERSPETRMLKPNVWAQRVMQAGVANAPAIALASANVLDTNPFIRDATDGVAYARRRDQKPELFASRLLGLPESGRETVLFVPDSLALAADSAFAYGAETEQDTSLYGGVQIDFRDYVFNDASEELQAEADGEADRFQVKDNIDEQGNYKPREYKLSFSSDLVYGTAGYDMLYGVQGVTQMMFSDMLGDHQIFVATNLLIDLRNSDYIVAYSYLPGRIDWSISGFHMSRLLANYTRPTYYQYRQYGGMLSASYALDKFRRLDANLSLLTGSQADIADPSINRATRTFLHPSITYTKDVSTPGFLYPLGGHRYAVSVSGSPGTASGEQTRFTTFLADARAYTAFGRGMMYSFAVRGSGGASIGPEQQMFYTSGVQNWVNRRFDPVNGFPISDASDFIFATPVMPLRGYDINAQNGSYFGLINAELRFPLVAALLPGPIPILPLYNIQGVAFLDAGSIWGGRGLDKRFNVFRKNEQGKLMLDDVMVGAGLGLRTIVLGYPVRLEWAWPFDGRTFGERHLYLSIGFDF